MLQKNLPISDEGTRVHSGEGLAQCHITGLKHGRPGRRPGSPSAGAALLWACGERGLSLEAAGPRALGTRREGGLLPGRVGPPGQKALLPPASSPALSWHRPEKTGQSSRTLAEKEAAGRSSSTSSRARERHAWHDCQVQRRSQAQFSPRGFCQARAALGGRVWMCS